MDSEITATLWFGDIPCINITPASYTIKSQHRNTSVVINCHPKDATQVMPMVGGSGEIEIFDLDNGLRLSLHCRCVSFLVGEQNIEATFGQ